MKNQKLFHLQCVFHFKFSLGRDLLGSVLCNALDLPTDGGPKACAKRLEENFPNLTGVELVHLGHFEKWQDSFAVKKFFFKR